MSVSNPGISNLFSDMQSFMQQASASGSATGGSNSEIFMAFLQESTGQTSNSGSSSTGATDSSGGSTTQLGPQTFEALFAMQTTADGPSSGASVSNLDPDTTSSGQQLQNQGFNFANLGDLAPSGATTQSATNSNGSTSTTITYADGSSVTLTVPAAASSSSSTIGTAATDSSTTDASTASSNPVSQYSPLEQLIAAQALDVSAESMFQQLTGFGSSGANNTTSGQQAQPADGSGSPEISSAQNLLAMLTSGDSGATSTVTDNSNGSTTTTITYANGSTVALTTAAPSGNAASSTGADSSSSWANNNLIEQMIQIQAQLLNPTQTVATA